MIWIVGAGLMAEEYIKVLKSLDEEFLVIGRSEESIKKLIKMYNCNAFHGGINNFLNESRPLPTKVINTVGIDSLTEVTKSLIKAGINDILIEKPGFGNAIEIKDLISLSVEFNAKLFIAYNRRYYQSVIEAKKIILEDGGVVSFCFEFTEWSHIIRDLKKSKVEHQNWFLGNSSHVIDTAFFLCGKPKEISCNKSGGLEWHSTASVFTGSGLSESGALFSYHSNWESAGRWSIDILTKKRRLIFKPIETLSVQKIGSINIESVDIDYEIDQKFKPGILLQTKAYLSNDFEFLLTIEEQYENLKSFYLNMSGYTI